MAQLGRSGPDEISTVRHKTSDGRTPESHASTSLTKAHNDDDDTKPIWILKNNARNQSRKP